MPSSGSVTHAWRESRIPREKTVMTVMTFCSALVLLLCASPSYTRLKPHELIAIADLMITGTIVEVSEETVLVEVSKIGFGEPRSSRIVVRRFRDWACASRWAEYAIDQHCLYYLAAGEAPGDPYRILGAGGEGERPLWRDGRMELPALASGPVAVDEWMAEARRYRQHFVRRGASGCRVERRCSAPELATYEESSELARALCQDTFAGEYRDPGASSPAPRSALTRWDLGLGRLPSALAALPDLDGDGIDELACAQESLWILYPGSAGELRRERFAGDAAFESDCTSLAFLGDLDRDGTLELAAGDPRASDGGSSRGVVRIFSLASNGKLERSSCISLSDPAFGDAKAGLRRLR